MKLIDTILLYNPQSSEVKVWDRRDGRTPEGYRCSVLAVFTDWPTHSPEERLSRLFCEAWQAVLRDGVPAEALHQELLRIDEYKNSLAGDV